MIKCTDTQHFKNIIYNPGYLSFCFQRWNSQKQVDFPPIKKKNVIEWTS